MFVKICGLTNFEDADAAVKMGAHALGFIFYPKSPRFIAPDHLRRWIFDLPSHVRKVGVFVNEAPLRIEEICGALGLSTAQLHGDETPAEHPRGVEIWKAFRVTPGNPPDRHYPADAILLDGPGGGRTFDWSLCAAVEGQVILAGGLDESNVAEAIRVAQPWGVDVSSGIEASFNEAAGNEASGNEASGNEAGPRRKDHVRMKRFIQSAMQPASHPKEAVTT